MTHESELGVQGGGPDESGVLTGYAYRQRTVGVDGADNVSIDATHQHHAGNIEGFGIGDSKTVSEFADYVELFEHLADLGPATVDHHWLHTHLAHEHHVLGKQTQCFRLIGTGCTGEHIASVFDDHRGVSKPGDVRQCLDEYCCLFLRTQIQS